MAYAKITVKTRRKKYGAGTGYKRCPRCGGDGRVRDARMYPREMNEYPMHDGFAEDLRQLMRDSGDERTRQTIQRMLDRLE